MIRRWGWQGAALLLALAFPWLPAPARADDRVSVGPSPWVDVVLQSGRLNVRTWDRPDVQVRTNGRVDVHHVASAQIPHQYTSWSQNVTTDRGTVAMPEESFVLPQLAGSAHDAVVARGSGDTTVMIPRGTALVTADVGTGHFGLRDYNGAFIAHVAQGGVALNRVQGSGYVEALRGPLTATNSTFERLRARTATGNMIFRGCTSHQIEASSNYGSILYDNGRFQPGLAHFESVHGNVALGVQGGAQIGARSGAGRIVTSYPNAARTDGRNSAQATVRGGGPVVTAVSKNGSVYIYNGSVRSHPRVQNELRQTRVLAPPHRQAPPSYPAPYQAPAARGYQAPRQQQPSQPYNAPRYQQPQPRYQPPPQPHYQQQPQPRYQQQPQPHYQPPQTQPPQQRGGDRSGAGDRGGGSHHDHPQPPASV